MKMAPSSAATKAPTRRLFVSAAARLVPTSTGATAAGSVRTLAAISQMRTACASTAIASSAASPLRATREPGEVGLALFDVGVTPLLRLVAHVEQQRRVPGELLDAGEPVLGRVERRLEHAQRQRRERQHLAAPLHRLLLEALERNDGIDQSPVQRGLRVVLAAEEPDLLRALLPDLAGEQPRPEAAVER